MQLFLNGKTKFLKISNKSTQKQHKIIYFKKLIKPKITLLILSVIVKNIKYCFEN